MKQRRIVTPVSGALALALGVALFYRLAGPGGGDPTLADYLTGTLLPLLDQPPTAELRTAPAPGRRGPLGPGAPPFLGG